MPLSPQELDAAAAGIAGQSARTSSLAAPDAAPDQVARAMQLKPDAPLAIVDDLDHHEQAAHLDAVSSAAQADPRFAAWHSTPERAALAKDDLGPISKLSGAIGRMLPYSVPGLLGRANDSARSGYGRDFTHTLWASTRSMVRAGLEWADQTDRNIAAEDDALDAGSAAGARGRVQAAEAGRQFNAGRRAAADAQADAIVQRYPDGGAAYHGLGVARSLPMFAGAALDPALGALFIGGTTAAQQRSQAKADGASDSAATLDGIANGSIEAGFDTLTLGLAKWGFKPLRAALLARYGEKAGARVLAQVVDSRAGRLALVAGEGAATEVPTTLAQMKSDEAILGKRYTAEDYRRGIRDSAVQGAGVSTTVYAATAPLRMLADHANHTEALVQVADSARAADALAASTQAAAEAKLTKRAPSEVAALAADAGHVYVPVEDARALYQQDDFDRFASEITGQADAAAVAGETGLLAIPSDVWHSRIAALPNWSEWAARGKLDADGHSAFDLQNAERMAAEFPDLFNTDEAATRATPSEPGTDLESQRAAIEQDIYGQLIASGRYRDTEAAANAKIASGLAVTAQRMGADPAAVYASMGLKIGTGAGVLATKPNGLDLTTDALFTAARTGKLPSDALVNGPSLLGFLTTQGGVQDMAGEIAGRDAIKQRPGLVNNREGVPLDLAREAAAEAGYLPADSTVADFLDLIDRDLRNGDVYSEANRDPKLSQFRDDALALKAEIDDAFHGVAPEVFAGFTNQQLADALSDPAALDRLLGRPSSFIGKLVDRVKTYMQGEKIAPGDALLARWKADPDAIAAEYAKIKGTQGGRVIDTDLVRELSPEYRADRTLSPQIHDAASSITKGLYARALAQPVGEGRDAAVLFKAGGGGSGKSTAATDLLGPSDADVEVDGTFSNLSRARQQIEDALKSGRDARIVYVYRSPANSAESAIARAIKNRRPVPVDVLADAHINAPDVVKTIAQEYAGNSRVEILAINNDGEREQAHFFPVEEIPNVDADEARTAFRGALEAASQTGRLDRKLYEAFAGSGASVGAQGTGGPERRGQAEDRHTLNQDPAAGGVSASEWRKAAREFVRGSKIKGVVYHATAADFDAFDTTKSDLGAHFGTSEQANHIAERRLMPFGNRPASIMPVYLNLENPLRLKDEGSFHADAIADQLARKGIISKSDAKRIKAEDWKGRKVNDPFVRDAIKAAGYDGVVYKNTQEGRGGDSYIAFEPTQIKSATGNRGTFDPNDPSILNQQPRRDNAPRGQLRLGDDGSFSIGLLEKADASTFIHEVGHVYFELMGRLAMEDGASEEGRALFDTLLRHGNIAGDTPEARRATWAGMDLEARRHLHEAVAEGFEAYVQEGRAPSPEMVGVFAQLRTWLLAVYRAIRGQRIPLTDSVREVFDRMLATDAEIDAVRARQGMAPVIDEATATAGGIAPAQYAAVKAQLEAAREAAVARLNAQALRVLQREQRAAWRAERAKVRAELEAQAEATPAIRAWRVLSGAKIDGLPESLQGLKLDSAAVKAAMPDGKVPAPLLRLGIFGKAGVSPDSAAMLLGFQSGDHLLTALRDVRDTIARLDAEADAIMRERHGDPMIDGTLADKAMRAAHNGAQVKALEAELAMLEQLASDPTATPKAPKGEGKPAAERAPLTPEQKQAMRERAAARAAQTRAFKVLAEQRVAGIKVRDLRPNDHLAAERRAALKAQEAAGKGDFVKAATAKREQILAAQLYRATRDAQARAEKQVRGLKRAGKASSLKRLGKAGKQYVDALKAMLDSHELRKVSGAAVSRREKLRAWVEAQQGEAHVTRVTDELLARVEAERVTNVADLTVGQLTELHEAVANLLHLAKLKNTLLKNKDAREWAEARGELLDRLRQAWPTATPRPFNASDMGMIERLADGYGDVMDWTLRPETLIEWLDGGEAGPWHDYYWQQINASRETRMALNREVGAALEAASAHLSKQDRADLDGLVHVPWLGRSVSRHTIVGLLLNMGTASSRDKLLRGGFMVDGERVPFDAAHIAGLLRELSPAHARFVQGVWDALETLWPRIAAHEEAMSGFAPPRLERQAVTFTARDGSTVSLQGGYFPAVYDPDAGRGGELQAQAQEQRLMGGDFTPAVTSKGHTVARTDYAAPMLLDYHRVLTRHLGDVITDLSYRRTLQQLLRILNDVEIRGAMKDRVSPGAHKVLMGSLRHTVSGPQQVADGIAAPIARVIRGTIRNTVVAALGFKVTLAVANTLTAPFLAAIRMSPRFIAAGLGRYYSNPKRQSALVHAMSPFMANRAEQTLVGYEQVMAELRGLRGWRHRLAEFALAIHHTINPIVERGLWIGRYMQAQHEGAGVDEAARLADKMIRTTQTVAMPEDLSQAERSPLLNSVGLNLFLGPMVIANNRLQDAGLRGKLRGNVRSRAEALGVWVALVFANGVLFDVLMGRGPDDEDDDGIADDWLKFVAKKAALFPVSTFPLLRSIAGALDYGSAKADPFTEAVNTLVRFGRDFVAQGDNDASALEDAIDGDSAAQSHVARHAANAAGVAVGLPTQQATTTGAEIYDLATGAETWDSPADARYLLVKRDR